MQIKAQMKESHQEEPYNNIFHRLEFHRNIVALLPDPKDRKPGIVFLERDFGKRFEECYCTCGSKKRKNCRHIEEMIEVFSEYCRKYGKKGFEKVFKSSPWYRIASAMAEGGKTSARFLTPVPPKNKNGPLEIHNSKNENIFTFFPNGSQRKRYMERLWGISENGKPSNRFELLEKIARIAQTDTEWDLKEHGLMSRKQSFEASFWYKTAYHCFRELGEQHVELHLQIDKETGKLTITGFAENKQPVFSCPIPRSTISRALVTFNTLAPRKYRLPIHPVALKSVYKTTTNKRGDLEIIPCIQFESRDGRTTLYEAENLEQFQYGNLIFMKDFNIFGRIDPLHQDWKTGDGKRRIIPKENIPEFFDQNAEELKNGPYILDKEIQNFRVYKTFNNINISPLAVEKDWFWISVEYGVGNSNISLTDILRTRNSGKRYIQAGDGWVDCQSSDFSPIDTLINGNGLKKCRGRSKKIGVSPLNMLRIQAMGQSSVVVDGKKKAAQYLKNFLELKSSEKLPKLKGLNSTLRSYQTIGVEWLIFLYENSFGGILCDEMGLGKTHQVMAFFVWLKEVQKKKKPLLVVCPATVLSHWENKLHFHAPILTISSYYGGGRSIEETLNGNDVVLTTFGILLRDIDKLEKTTFEVAVFDEAQYIKNTDTLSYQSALRINSRMKICLTGTPIENNPQDLKSLMDLSVPDYLGTNEAFQKKYQKVMDDGMGKSLMQELRRLIYPFTLRRLKKTVLSELPEKIEDILTCRLSDDQIKLYKDAIRGKGKKLLEELFDNKKPAPYIHIFALLNILKQICDHPKLVLKGKRTKTQLESGKWDLFKDLMLQCLSSDQKIVVYSQYLGMIDMISDFLREQKVGFVALTGKSRNRGRLIERFNEEPSCRVFVGSLRAGGVGIDLIAASVVIHYDRWWNAAREDQATDRVHRIGQRRGVQVFKLVTTGTLEEKISSIIEKKRSLMDGIIQEDDPGFLKTFSREQLIDLLSY